MPFLYLIAVVLNCKSLINVTFLALNYYKLMPKLIMVGGREVHSFFLGSNSLEDLFKALSTIYSLQITAQLKKRAGKTKIHQPFN